MSLDIENVFRSNEVSAVVCCKNRYNNLIESIKSWLTLDSITEIIVLDFGSDIPIKLPIISNKIKLYRYESKYWHLTKAYNIAIQLSTKNIILKLDSDYVLGSNFFINNAINNQEFLSGTNKDKKLCGLLMLHRRDFFKINGYNERIINYGWDDNDIRHRLLKSGLRHKKLNTKDITHIDHNNFSRVAYQPNPHIERIKSILDNQKESIDNPWTIKDSMSKYHD